ncbi:hypothetical protein HN031_06730 [Nocardioides sp. zg-1308]|uniref:hypothetical protein n=1 Tax=Nocardioides sp. zg-1308 TaxID=2736253 RepID=UPI00155164FB|nr:hypothetical protein [Nocardioides sp. zg-1308]NPD04382.1 hypothetical protein [Nocardioides sp. zg-1308]
MRSKIGPLGALLGVVAGLIAFSVTSLVATTVVSTGIAFTLGALVGAVVGVLATMANSSQEERWIRASWEQQAFAVRELVRVTVPAAVELATDQHGRLDPDRFQSLVVATVATHTNPRAGLGDKGPGVWQIDTSGARNPEQEQRLQRLLTYPDPDEAPAMIAALAGLGPQTIHQFSAFATTTRSRLTVGLEGVLTGPAGAALTGHLVAAGLVETVDGPPLGMEHASPDVAYYALTPVGLEVARLFAPTTVRPQELAALDPTPVR